MQKKSLIGKRQTVKKALVATSKPGSTSNLKPKGSPKPATASPGLQAPLPGHH